MDAELNLPVPEPLPHLPAHLPHLDMSGERPVVPAPHVRAPSVERSRLLVHVADADADEQVQEAERPELQQHVSPLEGELRVIVGAHDREVGEFVAAHQPPGDLPASTLDGRSGCLVRQTLAHVGHLPAADPGDVAERREVEVERLPVERGEATGDAG